jgi:hypothetical protein
LSDIAYNLESNVTTFTTDDRKKAQETPTVIVDSGASYEEPIPFAGIVELDPDWEEIDASLDDITNPRMNGIGERWSE